MKATDLTTLWSRILRGDHKAWQKLVSQYAALVYTVARRAGLSELDAEDCAQHTWLALYRKRRSIKDPMAIAAWLIRTSQREAVRMMKRLRRPASSEAGSEPVDGKSLPADEVSALEFQVVLAKALEQLDPRCRKLITEMYLSNPDKKYRDIAALIGVKPNSLGPLRKRCLTRLKDILKKMGYQAD